MKVTKKETTVDITGAELEAMIASKVQEALGEETAIAKIAITYKYQKREDGKGYVKTDEIKRVRVTC